MDAQELKATLLDLKSRLEDIKVNVFQIEDKKKRLEEIENELSQEKVWSDLELSQKLSKEKTNLQKIISKYQTVDQKVSDSEVLIDIVFINIQIKLGKLCFSYFRSQYILCFIYV